MNLKNIFFYSLILVVLVFEFYFGIITGVGFVIQVILLAVVCAAIESFFSKNKVILFQQRVKRCFFRILAVVGFFLSIFLLFTAYYVYFPGKISDIILTNGTQRVVFAGMSHIATDGFYTRKNLVLRELEKKGYIFLVEGVGAGSDASQKRFNDALGIQFDKDLYPSLASVAGLEVQSGAVLFSGMSLESMKNVDMSLDEIVALMGTGYLSSQTLSGGLDIGAEFDLIGGLPPQEQAFIRYVFRSLLNWSIVNMKDIEHIANAQNKGLFDIIVDRRNDKVVEYIVNHPNENIAIVYGALHFPGILESLRGQDPNWKIESYASDTPYSD